ncbi:MAG: acetate--CoA ligase family protein [Thermodesulfobacteriota bacterium]
MKNFFYPQSLAVIGVSENPANLAKGIVANLLDCGYQGRIFPIGPRGGQIFGLPILSHIRELPQPVDVAAILTPARFVPQVVADCGELGISRVVVESGGFSELGKQGRALEEEIRSLIKQYGLRLVGPNGLGVMNMEIGLALPFSQMRPLPRKGKISIISQSGGVGMHVIAWMAQEGLGVNKFVSLGNKLNVAENEVLAYFLQDPGTQAVYLYLEGLEDGRELLKVARQAKKPIFLQVPNVGAETAAIAWSHTASLASDDRVVDAACRQGNIIRIKSQADFLVAAKMVGQAPVKGKNLVVLSRSGGEAVIAAYACRQWGFRLPPLSTTMADFIHESSRSKIIKPTNPIDLGDIFDFSVYSRVMADLCRDPEVDAVLVNYGPVYDPERAEAWEMARHLVEQARTAKKPLAITVCASLEEEEYFRETLGVPVFHFPGQAVRALAYSRDWYKAAAQESSEPAPAFPQDRINLLLAQATVDRLLPMAEALSLIDAVGLPVASWHAAGTPDEARSAADKLGFPVCLKLAAPSLVHKTELGGVILNLKNAAAVTDAFEQLAALAREKLPPSDPWQVLVMAQIQGGEEVIIGARRDPSFGPVIAFGAGGIWTEVLEDISLRIAPISVAQAREQILETKIGRILKGLRGRPPADLEALSRALSTLAHLMLQFPQIQEVDLNPVRTFPGQPGLLTLDARVRVE